MKNLEYYLKLDYEIKLRKIPEDEEGGWFAEILQLPGCMSDGKTPEEAIDNLDDAKKSWIETCLELGCTVPEPITDEFPGQLIVRIPKTLHRALAEIAKEEKVSLNQYINFQLSRVVGFK